MTGDELRYLELEDIVRIHARIFATDDATARRRLRDPGVLESALGRPLQYAVYQGTDVATQAAILAPRQRLVAAQDDERRRLERNLHDGAQQHLVAIKVKLGLAEMLATRDPEKARAAVAELKHDADEALETLRDLARGIYPPLLADRGLPTALQAQARKATLPVTVEADGIGRYSQDTEAALYFCILEALQNIEKYAQASSAVVRLREEGDQLSVELDDDGRGFDVSTTIRGNGLTNMEDRLEALGGTLQITSSPGHGTTLCVILPVASAVAVSG